MVFTPATNPPPALGVITTLPPVFVTAQKEMTDAQDTPVSVTAVTAETIEDAKITSVRDASIYAPNVVMTDFSARKLSNPRFRGVGASPNNPAVTTYYDGVPQFNANSSSIELLDVEQIEFVRGPQGALFGRNTVGGLINITSTKPSLKLWTANVAGTYGNYNFWDGRASASAPIVEDQLGFGAGLGWSSRDGYTKNDFTSHDLDSREAFFGKGQLLWSPAEHLEIRLLLTGERARDGDYALGDLNAIRANPHHVAHDFEGFTHRDLIAPTLLVNWHGEKIEAASITGGVWWHTEDLTDIDYTSDPALASTRQNDEKDFQFSQEFRLSSPKATPVELNDDFSLRWQSGVFIFNQNYRQTTVNDLSSLFVDPTGLVLPLPPGSRLNSRGDGEFNDVGVGAHGQATLTAWEKLDLTAGVRVDWEGKEARNQSATTAFSPLGFAPLFIPPGFVFSTSSSSFSRDKEFIGVSPQFGVSYRLTESQLAYGCVTRGYKAGGFNLSASAPAGNQAYDPEHSWNYEAGVKTSWLEDRLRVNAALFYADWQDLQLNVPTGFPGDFYIKNAGSACIKGAELEVIGRVASGWDVFAGGGVQEGKFRSGSTDLNSNTNLLQSVGGNKLPFTPDFNVNAGTQVSIPVCSEVTAFARAEVAAYGDFKYDSVNGAGQSSYSLANFRAGVRGKHWSIEGWVRNAFDTHYVPIALQYGASAPSGYIGESGAPVTFGVTAGIKF